MLENTTPERQLSRNDCRLTPVNCSYSDLFLAERLGDVDAAHRLVHVGADLRHGAPRLGDHVARQAAEAERHPDHHRHQRQCDQRQHRDRR